MFFFPSRSNRQGKPLFYTKLNINLQYFKSLSNDNGTIAAVGLKLCD